MISGDERRDEAIVFVGDVGDVEGRLEVDCGKVQFSDGFGDDRAYGKLQFDVVKSDRAVSSSLQRCLKPERSPRTVSPRRVAPGDSYGTILDFCRQDEVVDGFAKILLEHFFQESAELLAPERGSVEVGGRQRDCRAHRSVPSFRQDPTVEVDEFGVDPRKPQEILALAPRHFPGGDAHDVRAADPRAAFRIDGVQFV